MTIPNRTTIRLLLATTAAALTLTPVSANDSEAEWAVGGLVLRANADISMDSEELYISEGEVRVDYVYTNHAAEDREITIAFPLPPQPDPALPYEDLSYPEWDRLGFTTTVDGAQAFWEVADRAMIGTRDVTEAVEAAGYPLRWFGDYEYQMGLDALDDAARARLLASGLFETRNDYGEARVRPAWQVQRHIVRPQTFAAGKSVRVSHRYVPITGGSVGGALYPEVRNNPEFEVLDHYRERYCVDNAFLAGVDRRLAEEQGANGTVMTESWIGYVLKSGANWRGPIKRFRLVVDKGSEDNLVSLCMDGVKKTGPTTFEVVKENFEPTRDLDILLVKFYRIPGEDEG